MAVVLQDNRRIILRFDKGEEVMNSLAKFMEQQNILACVFNGIGSAYELELGFFNSHLKIYIKKPILEETEIINLVGNGAVLDGKPIIHAHGVFSKSDFSMVGGHVFKLITLATCEIFLIKLEGSLNRKNDPNFNLNLLN